MSKLLIVNGSVNGSKGNCAKVAGFVEKRAAGFAASHLVLKEASRRSVLSKLEEADCFLFLTGTYWESWGSPLQKFFEDFSELEASEAFLGKPAACGVLCHSTGGKSVLSRLQATLNLFGCVIPPFCGVEISLLAQVALRADPKGKHVDDIWSLADFEVVLKNLQAALKGGKYTAWPTDMKNFRKVWVETPKRS